ncbi:MAG: hypothetical protein Q8R82_07800 [Hyphomonadaceae bacterium]|nr:hypothetical protein [Hyphomonadaceae bacterium]
MAKRSLDDILGEPTPAKRGRRPGEGGRAPTPTRDRLNAAQAQLAETRAAKLRGELLDAGEVEARWTSAVLDVRAAILAVPSRFGARFGLPATQLAALDADLRDALAGLAAGEGGHAR